MTVSSSSSHFLFCGCLWWLRKGRSAENASTFFLSALELCRGSKPRYLFVLRSPPFVSLHFPTFPSSSFVFIHFRPFSCFSIQFRLSSSIFAGHHEGQREPGGLHQGCCCLLISVLVCTRELCRGSKSRYLHIARLRICLL